MSELEYPIVIYKFLQSVVDRTVDMKLEESLRLFRACEAKGLVEERETTETHREKNKRGKFEYYTIPNGEEWIITAEGELALLRYLEMTDSTRIAEDDDDTRLEKAIDRLGQRLELKSEQAEPTKSKLPASATAIEAILGEESKEILDIARSDKTASDKAMAICDLDKRALAWDSPRWADLLGVSDGAIRKGYFWRTDRPNRIKKERDSG